MPLSLQKKDGGRAKRLRVGAGRHHYRLGRPATTESARTASDAARKKGAAGEIEESRRAGERERHSERVHFFPDEK